MGFLFIRPSKPVNPGETARFPHQSAGTENENQFEKLNVLLAAGEVPDMIAMRLNPVQVATYADQGVLAELPVGFDPRSDAGVLRTRGVVRRSAGVEVRRDRRQAHGRPIISPRNVYRRGIA